MEEDESCRMVPVAPPLAGSAIVADRFGCTFRAEWRTSTSALGVVVVVPSVDSATEEAAPAESGIVANGAIPSGLSAGLVASVDVGLPSVGIGARGVSVGLLTGIGANGASPFGLAGIGARGTGVSAAAAGTGAGVSAAPPAAPATVVATVVVVTGSSFASFGFSASYRAAPPTPAARPAAPAPRIVPMPLPPLDGCS